MVVVEGDDDGLLLESFSRSLNLSGIQIITCKGTGSMSDVIRAVRNTPDFENRVTSLGIVRDAEKDARGAFQSVCSALHSASLPVPQQPLTVAHGTPSVIVLIWSYDRKLGMLEDVCLQSVSDHPEMICVNEFFECLQRQGVEQPRNLSKAKVQAFLASRPETYPHLGVAAMRKVWPFDNKAFNGVKEFLKQL